MWPAQSGGARKVGEMAEIGVSDKIDRAFVFELAKRGNVRVLSQQVVLETVDGRSVDLSGLILPAGVTIDWFSARPTKDEWHPIASITFRFE